MGWSGSRKKSKAIEELREVQQQGERPIILKVPPGLTSREVKLNTCEEAIQYLQDQTAVLHNRDGYEEVFLLGLDAKTESKPFPNGVKVCILREHDDGQHYEVQVDG